MDWDQIVKYREEVGDKLATLRLEKGITGRDVSRALSVLEEGGKSKGTISRIEHGSQTITTDVLMVYSELLGKSIADLVTIDETLESVLTDPMDKMNQEYREMAVSVLNALWSQYCMIYEKPKRVNVPRFVLVDTEEMDHLGKDEQREVLAFIAYYKLLQKKRSKK